jgi:hypothetical protein
MGSAGTRDVLILPSHPRRQKTVNNVVTMRIGVAVKNDMNFCKRLFQMMQSSIFTFLPYPGDILGRWPEGKTDRVLWNDLSLRVLQGNGYSSMGGS